MNKESFVEQAAVLFRVTREDAIKKVSEKVAGYPDLKKEVLVESVETELNKELDSIASEVVRQAIVGNALKIGDSFSHDLVNKKKVTIEEFRVAVRHKISAFK